MYNNKEQIISFLKRKRLDYFTKNKSKTSSGQSTWYCVYDKEKKVALEFNPFSNVLYDKRSEKTIRSNTVETFIELCSKLSEE